MFRKQWEVWPWQLGADSLELWFTTLSFNHSAQWAFWLKTEVTLRDSPTVLTDGKSFILCFVSSYLRHLFIPHLSMFNHTVFFFLSLIGSSVLKVSLIAWAEDTQQCFYTPLSLAWFVMRTEKKQMDNMTVYRQKEREDIVWHRQYACCTLICIYWLLGLAKELLEPK